MKNSQLVAIISRLEAMQKEENGEIQTRHFEREGVEKGIVEYDPAMKAYTLEDLGNHTRFPFDDIDLIAMEVYDLLFG
ncbi:MULTISPECIES: YkuJ family protein [Dellaglioa]|uniref:DUF1797 family protein n=3 Tax=Dellaglioa TaxID=2767880 RepID=A0A0R1HIG0_9LACO|nr:MULTISPECIES: YkuJ family protein [Dellaglioa]KRK46095.1 hypothetical protein FC66_GL000596 [Dellaglioa algida DSM 15638]MCZ2490555.1 YkuJ family protein [Dellaglioa carnosa]MCZ2492184.1 YkuJ family protein [Dellaglioa carnosa]MCZ2493633.1 YkuJ family protein [Dellaglioa carnosa]MDK1716974.1 YkuJ family protein [Dellaglioa algida]